MNESVFVYAEDEDDRSNLSAVLSDAGYLVGTGPTIEVSTRAFPLELCRAVVAVTPSTQRGIAELGGLRQAAGPGVPWMLLDTSTSLRTAELPAATVTVRLDRTDLTNVVELLKTMLEHTPIAGEHGAAVSGPTLGPEALQFVASIRQASDADRLTRQAAMFLSQAGVALAPPSERGPDFIGWSDSLGSVFGNPFLVEIKKVGSPPNDPHRLTDSARRWLATSGVKTAFVLIVSEFAEPALTSTREGGLVIELPLVELIEATQSRSLLDAIRLLVERTGVRL